MKGPPRWAANALGRVSTCRIVQTAAVFAPALNRRRRSHCDRPGRGRGAAGDKSGGARFDRTGAAGDSAGDILTFANEVFDADDKAKVGTDQGICFRTLPGKAWECFWTLTLDKGQITVEGPFLDSGDSVLAITGGTGEFAGATGEMALSPRGTDGKAYNFSDRIK